MKKLANGILAAALLAAMWARADIELYAPQAGTPSTVAPVALTYAADCTPDCDDGLLRKCTLTGNIEINPPTHPAEGMKWECWLTCDGTARTLTLDAAILVPTESTVTWPKTLVASKTFILLLKYNGTKWMLASLVGAY